MLAMPAADSETLTPVAAGRVLVTVATYNELENLPDLVDAIWEVAPQADVLVIDDNSPDGTGRWCDERSAAEPRLFCLHRAGKLGLGTATIAGMRYASEHGYDFVLNMDADFSHHPRYIPAILAAMDEADVAIGSRYCPGGGTEGWPLARRWMSWGVNTYARALLGLSPRDTSGAFRCYRAILLERLDFDAIVSRGYSFQEEILWRLKRLGARMVEVPIVFADRQRGHSKINKLEALAAIGILFRLGLKNWLGLR
jgi:dolichol-phosphate mannosyltransferase